MTRKIVQTGSSLAVTLPCDVVEQFKLKKGDEVDVSVHPQTGAITSRVLETPRRTSRGSVGTLR
jgi:antitoxin component of MazEF toxin-antitoxin module